MPKTSRPLRASIPAALVGLALAACASPEPNPTLLQAQNSVASVSQDPVVTRQAPLELQKAQQLLRTAQASDGQDEVTHRAYLAAQQAAIARETAVAREAQEQIQVAEAQRSETLLSARTDEVRSAQARIEELERELRAEQTPRGMVVTLGDVLFRTDSAELLPGAAAHLDRLASVLQENPDYRVQVEGYTDSTGSADYNLELSQARAESVRRALVARGIDPDRVDTQGYGEARPVASNASPGGRQLNRRVEIVLSGPGLPETAGTLD